LIDAGLRNIRTFPDHASATAALMAREVEAYYTNRAVTLYWQYARGSGCAVRALDDYINTDFPLARLAVRAGDLELLNVRPRPFRSAEPGRFVRRDLPLSPRGRTRRSVMPLRTARPSRRLRLRPHSWRVALISAIRTPIQRDSIRSARDRTRWPNRCRLFCMSWDSPRIRRAPGVGNNPRRIAV
jgi:hypothetical protein